MTTPIDYAPRQPWHRRRNIRRAAISLAVILLVAFVAYQYGPAAWRRARILYWQNRCMNHVEPPGMVVTETTVDPKSGIMRTFSLVCGDREGLRRAVSGSGLSLMPPDNDVIFLHARSTAAGERLVTVIFYVITAGTSPPAGNPMPVSFIMYPGSLTDDPMDVRPNSSNDFRWCRMLTPGDTLRIYAGQPDPADESAFTFDYDLNSVRHTARYRLNAAGDSIEFVSITPPL